MKRYDCYWISDQDIKHDTLYREEEDGEWCKYSDHEAELAKKDEEIARLRRSLIDHRADLHCYSSRPCPTCRQSAEVLGITDKVPGSCAIAFRDCEALERKGN